MSNGTGTSIGGGGGNTGLPGLLEIQAGPAFWLKQDQAEPVFYPAGTSLLLGPISDKLGIGTARIVAIAPDGKETFQANLSLADFSGDWSAIADKMNVTLVDCPGYSSTDEGISALGAYLLQFFSGYGTYVRDGDEPTSLNLIWEGTLPEEMIGSSEVTVDVDKVTLHYRFEIPDPAENGGSSWLPWSKLGQRLGQGPLQQHNALLSAWPALPLLGAVAWLQRRRRKWAWLALASLLLLGALLLSSCVGVWGTIDVTYTFDKLEYIDPQQAAAGSTGGAEDQTGVIWKLTNGQGVVDLDLIIESDTSPVLGETVMERKPCKLTATGSATGIIGPDGSVAPPDMGE